MKDIEILQLRATEPDLYRLAIVMEEMFRNGRHFRGDNLWTVKAKHKVTKEKLELETTATSAAEARATIRHQLKDTQSPYQWELGASPAVPGLGRNRRWTDVVAA
jgi:hypothetical protein